MSRQTVGPGDWAVITLEGEIDLARADDLARVLATTWNSTKNLLVDLCPVTFMDSTGLRWLFDTHQEVTKAHREMRLIVCEDSPIERLLAIVAAKDVFTVYRNLDKALERISAGEISPIMDGPSPRQFGPPDG